MVSNPDVDATLQNARRSLAESTAHFDANAILRGAQLTIVGGMRWAAVTVSTSLMTYSATCTPKPRSIHAGTLSTGSFGRLCRYCGPSDYCGSCMPPVRPASTYMILILSPAGVDCHRPDSPMGFVLFHRFRERYMG